MNARTPILAAALLAASSLAPAAEPLVQEAEFAVPVQQLWDAWATAEGQKAWHAPHVEIDLRPGGLMRVNYNPAASLDDPTTITNEILCHEPGRMLAMRVHTPPAGFPFPNAAKNTWSVIHFEPDGEHASRMRVVGLGYDDTDESRRMRAYFEAVNPQVVAMLRKHLEGGDSPAVQQAPAAPPDFSAHAGPWWTIDRERPDGTRFRVCERWAPGPAPGAWSYSAWMGNQDAVRLHQQGMVWAVDGELRFHMIDQDGATITGAARADGDAIAWPWRIEERDGAVSHMLARTRVDEQGRLSFVLERDGSTIVNLLSEARDERPEWVPALP